MQAWYYKSQVLICVFTGLHLFEYDTLNEMSCDSVIVGLKVLEWYRIPMYESMVLKVEIRPKVEIRLK